MPEPVTKTNGLPAEPQLCVKPTLLCEAGELGPNLRSANSSPGVPPQHSRTWRQEAAVLVHDQRAERWREQRRKLQEPGCGLIRPGSETEGDPARPHDLPRLLLQRPCGGFDEDTFTLSRDVGGRFSDREQIHRILGKFTSKIEDCPRRVLRSGGEHGDYFRTLAPAWRSGGLGLFSDSIGQSVSI